MQTMYVKSGEDFLIATEAGVAEVAGNYGREAFNRERPVIGSPAATARALKSVYAGRDYETFTERLIEALP